MDGKRGDRRARELSEIDATIVVPTFNRRDVLVATLGALASIEYPPDRWEVIVVDDGSGDDTEGAVRAWMTETSIRVRYESKANGGPAAARNRGAVIARGRVLVFIDNDVVVAPDFLALHLATLAAHPDCWVVGRVVQPPVMRGTPFGRYREAVSERFHRAQPADRLSETDGVTGQNLSLPAVDFHRLGGFDETFTIASGEDWELGQRARQLGIRILYHPGIVVLHNDWAVSLERFCERQRLYSISDVLLFQKYREASPRARLVRENGPIRWSRDFPWLALKKALKRGLASASGQRMVRACCRASERFAPDSRLTWRAYEAAVALAIFRGVRDGVERYGMPEPEDASAAAL